MKVIVAIFVSLFLAASTSSAQTTCPAANTDARRVIDNFLSDPVHTDARAQYGIAAAAPGAARLLATTTDGAACGRLNMFLSTYGTKDWRTSMRVNFFAYGNRYYVALTPISAMVDPAAGTVNMKRVPLIVLDASYNKVVTFAL